MFWRGRGKSEEGVVSSFGDLKSIFKTFWIISMTQEIGTFPFGQPIMKVCQSDRTPKKVFILGVYASAVHAKWFDENEKEKVKALAVDSEPEIFWRGENAKEIIEEIKIPKGTGRLLPADDKLNGPSGVALDDRYLIPLGLTRSDVWLCDLVPHSCRNERQFAALKREYDPKKDQLQLPEYNWPEVPPELADTARQAEILDELKTASSSVIITLGDQPLKWFTSKLISKSRLRDYGDTDESYGQVHNFFIDGRPIQLLPLVHPRQAGRLGRYSPKWADRHDKWVKSVAPGLVNLRNIDCNVLLVFFLLNCFKFLPDLTVQPIRQILIWHQFRCKRY